MEKKEWIILYEKYMMIMGPLSNLMFYIQAYKIFATRQATGVSLFAFVISAAGVGSWFVYGILLKSKVLLTAGAIGVVGVVWVLMGIVLYG